MRFCSLWCAVLSVSFPAIASEADNRTMQIIYRNLSTPNASALRKKDVAALPSIDDVVVYPPVIADHTTAIAIRPYRGTYTVPLTDQIEIGVSKDDYGRSEGVTYKGDGYKIHVGRLRSRTIIPDQPKQPRIGAFLQIPF